MNQQQTIIYYLATKGSITPMEAMTVHRIYRLAARIAELKKQGYKIKASYLKDLTGKRYAKYRVEQ